MEFVIKIGGGRGRNADVTRIFYSRMSPEISVSARLGPHRDDKTR
jgi:hypothetical protein